MYTYIDELSQYSGKGLDKWLSLMRWLAILVTMQECVDERISDWDIQMLIYVWFIVKMKCCMSTLFVTPSTQNPSSIVHLLT